MTLMNRRRPIHLGLTLALACSAGCAADDPDAAPGFATEQYAPGAEAPLHAGTIATRASATDYVKFVDGSGCSSSVGRVGGVQQVTLNSACSTGNAIHEIGHAVGLWHEQSRSDRDSFVTINYGNIQAGMSSNFDKYDQGL